MLKKALLFFLLAIALLFLTIIGATYYLLGTESGFSWTAAKLQNIDERMSLATMTGNLSEGVATDRISWEDKNLSIQANGVDSKWSSACLLKTSFCLEYLDIDEIRIETQTPDDAAKVVRAGPLELPTIALPFRFESKAINIKKLIIENDSGSPPQQFENIHLQAKANRSSIAIESLRTTYQKFDVELAGEFELEDNYPLDAKLNINARELIDGEDFQVIATLTNTLRNLKASGSINGTTEILFNADIQPLETKLPARANITWKELAWPLRSKDTIRTGKGRLVLVGDLDNYAVRLSTSISGPQIPVTEIALSGDINAQRAIIPRIDLFLLDGFVTGSVAANWTNGVNWISELIFKEINPGKQWQQMPGKLNGLVTTAGSATDRQWAMQINRATVDGTLRQFPFTLDAVAARSIDNNWIILSLTLEDGPNVLNATGNIGKEISLDVLLDFPALHALLPGVAGDISAEATLSGNLANPGVKVNASSKIIKFGNALLRDLQLDGDIVEAGISKSQLDISVDSITANAQQISSIKAALRGTREQHRLAASGDGPQKTRLQLTTSGSLAPEFDWKGKLDAVTLDVPEHQLSLEKPVSLSWSQQQKRAQLDPHCWLTNSAKLCLKNPVSSDKKGTASLNLAGYALSHLNNLLPGGASLGGKLGADSVLSWDSTKADGFSAQLDASISQGSITLPDKSSENPLVFGYEKLRLKTTADPNSVVADVELSSSTMGNGTVSFTLDPKSEQKSILGEIKLNGFDISFLQAFLPDYETIAGTINANGKIQGSLSDPDFDGRISLVNPVVKSDDLPLPIDGGIIHADIKSKTADLSGTLDSGEGSIEIGGGGSWSPQTWSGAVTLDGKKLVIVQKPIVHSEVYPSVKINLKPGLVEVRGRVTIPTAEINIKDRAQGGATLSEDVVIIEDEVEQTEEIVADSRQMSVITEVDVFLGNDVNLSGYGLEAKLSGEINVLKKDRDPTQLGGEIRVVEGFYKSYGQDLNIKDGQILFVGPIEQTTLNIDAVREIENDDDNRVAGLHLEGQIADPSVTLFTEPADKSQESILSYIVLGRDLGATSQGESNLLAQAALALTLRQGRGFATGFAESLGISDFSIDASGRGDDTQVVVTGRLSSKLLLRYGRSVFVPEQTLFLRYDISRRLYLEAAQGVERAVDLFYSFSF